MKVVLRVDVSGVGRKGDVLDVADGYARNYLLPKRMALTATPGVEAQAEAMRRARALRSAAEKTDAIALAEVLKGTTVRITKKAGREGKLFGSVSASDVAQALSAQTGADVDRRSVELHDPIKSTGSHTVTAKLHPEVETTIAVEVVAQ